MKVLTISADYPSPENIYGDAFVHSRLKKYSKCFEVQVVGLNTNLDQTKRYYYEEIFVIITPDFKEFCSLISEAKPDIIAVHFIMYAYFDFLLSLKKPLVVFFHGHEVLSWTRRLMNYDSIGSVRYLLPYAISNHKQRIKLKSFIKAANQRDDIHFVFVSNWLHQAALSDLNLTIKNVHVIPNGIDLDVFSFTEKRIEARKKILLLRSFKARNYANDIAIDAIRMLSHKSFFSDLKFCVQGEGYLFKPLTEQLKGFKNVLLNNFFVENKHIPAIHKDHGIFLCPSRMDTQGVSMCEAMASGLVPITSRVGGIPEFTEHTISSFQVNSSEEIVDRIEQLYYNPELFQKMSFDARRDVENKCSLERTTKVEMDLFQSLIPL